MRLQATDDGMLLYQTGSQKVGSVLQWFDRNGRELNQMSGDNAYYDQVSLSPDGKTAADLAWNRTIAFLKKYLVG